MIKKNKFFINLFQNYFKDFKKFPGNIIKCYILSINRDYVVIDSGFKSESYIPLEQFKLFNDKCYKKGDIIDVVLEDIENGFGQTLVSYEKSCRYKIWKKLEQIYNKEQIITGIINGKVKGGFTVELKYIRAFLPGSLVDTQPINDINIFKYKKLEFKVIKIDQQRNNVVVSRRAVIECINLNKRNKLIKNFKQGMIINGVIKNITDYGAFIDMGGVDGLLHITDMSWRRIKHPNEILNIGNTITVKVLNFDKFKNRVSLGLKQLYKDPWVNIKIKYPKGCKVNGYVSNLTDYGCFVEIEEGIEGLVHISEMNWVNKNINPYNAVKINDYVKVMILDIDEHRRRISLGLKQCKINPWKDFSKKYKIGDTIKGIIKSITNFGIFIDLVNGINGLARLSDISDEKIHNLHNIYKKGDQIISVILYIDVKRERVSLGVK